MIKSLLSLGEKNYSSHHQDSAPIVVSRGGYPSVMKESCITEHALVPERMSSLFMPLHHPTKYMNIRHGGLMPGIP